MQKHNVGTDKNPLLWSIAGLLYTTFPKTKSFTNAYFGDLCGVGLRPSQNMIISLLDDIKECSMSELADTLNIAKANMTTLVDPLVEAGYITREPGRKDRRVIIISLTVKGKKYLNECKEHTYTRLEQQLSDLDEKELAELEKAVKVLRKVLFSRQP